MSNPDLSQIFSKMVETFDASKTGGIDATILFDLGGESGGQYWLKISANGAETGSGPVENPTMTLKASAEDWIAVATGQSNPMQAFMSGKLKIQGDMGLAMKLQSLLS